MVSVGRGSESHPRRVVTFRVKGKAIQGLKGPLGFRGGTHIKYGIGKCSFEAVPATLLQLRRRTSAGQKGQDRDEDSRCATPLRRVTFAS